MSAKTVPCSQEDFLDQDKPIRGQNFVCLSFISPEEVILKKEAFFFERYMSRIAKDLNELFAGLAAKYPNDEDGIRAIKDRHAAVFDAGAIHIDYASFVSENPDLEKEYHEKNGFQTSIRGIKVRGVYDSIAEAQKRSELLKRQDNNKFNIFVAQVGCWCPWSPNPSELEEQEFAETQLNTLMKSYRDNMAQKEAFFEERKDELMKKALLANKNNNQNQQQQQEEGATNAPFSVQIIPDADVPADAVPAVPPQLESDPWLSSKEKQV
jgi:hypothetical protein